MMHSIHVVNDGKRTIEWLGIQLMENGYVQRWGSQSRLCVIMDYWHDLLTLVIDDHLQILPERTLQNMNGRLQQPKFAVRKLPMNLRVTECTK